ncbi:MAG: hypothetical protein HY234_00735 [Acidobacteria bacterium]|nr:hypothetical protein [Acidobacteriota bacterium]MBI3661566.1 hypothetical protein [Acidobacteriota bacterium]
MSQFDGAQVLLWSRKLPELAHVAEALVRRGCAVQALDSLEQVQAALEESHVNLIVAQMCSSCREWKDLLRAEAEAEKLPPVLLVAGDIDVDLYLDAMSRGAFDCIPIPLNERELIRIASHALECQAAMPDKGA